MHLPRACPECSGSFSCKGDESVCFACISRGGLEQNRDHNNRDNHNDDNKDICTLKANFEETTQRCI